MTLIPKVNSLPIVNLEKKNGKKLQFSYKKLPCFCAFWYRIPEQVSLVKIIDDYIVIIKKKLYSMFSKKKRRRKFNIVRQFGL